MSLIFADTFYFLALVNRRDVSHARAVEFGERPDLRLVTTTWVLTEVIDALSTPTHRTVAVALVRKLQNDRQVTIVSATQDWFDRGLELFEARADKAWTLTDCVSFTVMQSLGLTEALTADRHFEQAGFKALLTQGS
jgi:predicted nucleic acid-binding protein